MKTLLSLAVALVALSGCNTWMPVLLDQSEAKTLKSVVRVKNTVWQDELVIRAPGLGATGAAGGGLLVALIDSKVNEGRQSELQDRFAAFYAPVDDYDFRGQLATMIEQTLTTRTPLKFDKFEHSARLTSESDVLKELEALTNDQAFMSISSSYTLTPDFKRLNIAIGIDLIRGGSAAPIHSNVYIYQSDSVDPGVDPIQAWSENGGKLYRETMNKGLVELGNMISTDLSSSASPQAVAAFDFTYYTVEPQQMKGSLIAEQSSRITVRGENGQMYSVAR